MAGIHYAVVPRTLYDFSNLKASQVQTVLIAKTIPVQSWIEGTLLVRFHSTNGTSWASGCSIAVNVVPDGYSDEDPNTDFTLPGSPLATVTITSSDMPPRFPMAPFTGGMGGFVRVTMVGTQAGTPGAFFQGYISIDLSLKA